jgi:hypothetical protein
MLARNEILSCLFAGFPKPYGPANRDALSYRGISDHETHWRSVRVRGSVANRVMQRHLANGLTFRERSRDRGRLRTSDDTANEFGRTHAETMIHFLSLLRERHGSTRELLGPLGVSDEVVAKLWCHWAVGGSSGQH